jgi:hypothetical protein
LEQGRQLGRIRIEVNAILGVNAVYVPTPSKPLKAKKIAIKYKIYLNFGFNNKDLSPLSKKVKTKS